MTPRRRIAIRNGRVLDPANGVDTVQDLFIASGQVLALGRAPEGFEAQLEIDATGQVVCPGLVDLCAHLREPGREYKADIASESRAAVDSGITTLCCPPETDPVVDTPAVVELIRQRAEAAGNCRVVTLGALTRGLAGEMLSEMAALRDAGCVGISNGRRPVINTLVQRRALEYAASFDLRVFLCPEDSWLRNDGCVHEGEVATRLGLPGIPEAAETAAVARDLALVEQTGVRAHFCRLTSNRAVRMVARARYDGLPVTADTAIPYLWFTEMDIAEFNSQFHLDPPLRTQGDREGLRSGLARGVIEAVCSDHQPHEADAKLAPFPATEPGMSGLETLLPMALRLVDEKLLTLGEIIARLTSGPAEILGLDLGHLAPAAAADVCVFDPEAIWRLDTENMLSRGHNTPFNGWELKGRVSHTVFDGRLVFNRQSAER